MIKEVSSGLTEKKEHAVVIEFTDLANEEHSLTLAGGDIESFEKIWGFARQAIKQLEAGNIKPDKIIK